MVKPGTPKLSLGLLSLDDHLNCFDRAVDPDYLNCFDRAVEPDYLNCFDRAVDPDSKSANFRIEFGPTARSKR